MMNKLEAKKLLLKQLNALKKTMSKINKNNAFDMSELFARNSQSLTGSFGYDGFVACIRGHQAASGKLDNFALAKQMKLEKRSPLIIADSIDEDLNNASVLAFNSDDFVKSIYHHNNVIRKHYATNSGQFTDSELDKFAHLNSAKPTPKDVVDYLNACIEKVGA